MKSKVIKKSQSAIFVLFILTLLLFPLQAWSQAQGKQGTGQITPDTEKSEITDAQITAFAKSQNQVFKIQQKYNSMYAEAADDSERQEIAQKANDEMVAAIESEGLTIEVYNSILNEAQNNPQTMERINKAIEALQ